MKLIDKWPAVLGSSWSVRLSTLASVAATVSAVSSSGGHALGGDYAAAYPILDGLFGVSSGTFAALGAGLAAAAVVARVVAQPKLQAKLGAGK